MRTLNTQEVINGIGKLFDDYQILSPLYAKRKLAPFTQKEYEARKRFAMNLCNAAHFINYYCERDRWAVESSEAYRLHYQQHIHPHFRVLQRFTNFFHRIGIKEGAQDCGYQFEMVPVNKTFYLGFYRESQGFTPVTLLYQPVSNSKGFDSGIEVNYLRYGDTILNGQQDSCVFITDHCKLVTQSGFLIDLSKLNEYPHFIAKISGFYGLNTSTPLQVSPGSWKVSLNVPDIQMQHLFYLLQEEIESWQNSNSQRDVFFIPLFDGETESREFAYCLLQDLIVRSYNRAQPEEQQLAQAWLKQIEQVEGKTIEAVVADLEKEIKQTIRSEYEREVEEQQLQRSKSVAEGVAGRTTAAPKTKKKQAKQKAESAPSTKPLDTTIEKEVEDRFKTFRVQGRIKYNTMMKVTRKILKKCPETFAQVLKDEKQHGSHHVLHLEKGNTTLVHPHGSKDKTVSAKTANRFLGAIIDQVKSAFSNPKKDKTQSS